MTSLAERMRLALDHRRTLDANPDDVTQATLARASQVQPPSVNGWLSGKTKSLRGLPAVRAAKYLGVSFEWLVHGSGPMLIKNADVQTNSSLDHRVSLEAIKLLPPILTQGDLMSAPLPAEFRLCIPEGPLSPLVPAGATITFDTRQQPGPGDGILVRDRAGDIHFRRFRPGVAGQWQAFALKDAYRTLDSELDGLEVLAVYVGSGHRLRDL